MAGNRGVGIGALVILGLMAWCTPSRHQPVATPPTTTTRLAAYQPSPEAPPPPSQLSPHALPAPISAGTQPWTAFTTSAVKLRASPDGAVIGTVPRGAGIRAMEASSGWRRVVYEGAEGWVADRYLSTATPAASPTPAKPAPTPAPVTPQIARAAPAEISDGGPIRSPYVGRCECPYDVMRNGRSCGGRSAYSRPGGAQPRCYR